jgi:hypothetical protein
MEGSDLALAGKQRKQKNKKTNRRSQLWLMTCPLKQAFSQLVSQ